MVLLVGCSTTTFLYNRADFILPWALRDYVSLDREQRQALDQMLVPLLAWHRMEELPRYVALLEQMEAALDEPVTMAVLEEITVAFESAWARLESRSVSLLIDLGETLRDEQMAEFLEHMARQTREYEEKYLDRDDREYAADNFDRLRDTFQDYLGRLDASQRQRLQEAAAQLRRADRPWLHERARWRDLLADILQREPGWQQRLWDALAARPDEVSAEYLEVYGHNTRVLHQAIADVLNSRSAKQDERLRRKLGNFRQDFQTLVEQGRKRATP
jgi:hypothetical protein